MPIGKKLTVVLSVVVAGASVAFFFRKDASPFRFWQEGSDDPFGQRVERRVTSDVDWVQRGLPARSVAPDSKALRVPAAATAAISQPKGLVADSQPAFQRNLNPVGALLPPIEGIVGEEDQFDTSHDLNSPDGRPFKPAATTSRHVVVDGDTLTTLAVRYLGRAEAYQEIFELNRDLLASPDLLPIGAELKIPPRKSAGTAGTPLAGGGLDLESPLKMVPVPDKDDQATP
ncbi:MAG: tail protein X [Pirellulales bacterium]